MAVPREHVTIARLSLEQRDNLIALMLKYVEKHQQNGMLDDRPREGLLDHYSARWVPINNLVISSVPRELADRMALLTQEAVEWFHEPAHMILGDPTVRVIPDAEVRERIMGMQYAMDKEVIRIAGGPQITQFVNPETMEGYDDFLTWYAGWERLAKARELPDLGTQTSAPLRYDLTRLPFDQQRALVEQWERAHVDYLAVHPEIGYDVDGGYLRKPFRIFDRAALQAAVASPMSFGMSPLAMYGVWDEGYN